VALGLDAAKRLAPPSPSTLRSAVADLRKVMKDVYAVPGKPGKRALAEALLARADAAGDDADLRYALLNEAREAAMAAIEPSSGLAACDALAAKYEVDGDALVREMLSRCGSEPAAEAYGTLRTRPDDAKALARVGRYEAAVLGHWDSALPRLAKGDDQQWAKAARAELAAGDQGDPGAAAAVADAWYELSRKTNNSAQRLELAAHAQQWYKRALPGLTGTALDLAKLHSQDLADELPVGPGDYDHLTQKQWDHLDAPSIAVAASNDRIDTGDDIPAGVRLRIIPAPEDQWLVEPPRQDAVTCGPAGVSGLNRGRFLIGQLCASLDPNRPQPLGVLNGPGRLYFFPIIPPRGLIDGSIRVKLVQLP
jgi:hypothetical protein